jgi:hypothetical protein
MKTSLSYSTQLGCQLLRNCKVPPDLVATKWSLILPPNFTLNWDEVWDPERARKEAGLL